MAPPGDLPPPLVVPPPLRRGDRVAVVAPSSPFEAALGWRGLGVLAERYDVRWSRGLFARRGYLAGDDVRRADELRAALLDPEVRLILAARGGWGALRFATDMPWDALRAHPRWIAGFSDITALHVEAARVGVASLHAAHLTSLGRSDARTRDGLFEILERRGPRRWDGLSTLRAGTARGPLFGGNLTVLHACAAAGRLRVPEGAVILLEDVTERPYRIDRMLTSLLVGGHLARAAAVVLGDFTACDPGPDGTTVRDVLEERLGGLGIPVVLGLPVGHELRNDPVVLGLPARVDAYRASASVIAHDD